MHAFFRAYLIFLNKEAQLIDILSKKEAEKFYFN